MIKNKHLQSGYFLFIAGFMLSGCFAGQSVFLKEPLQNEQGLLAPGRSMVHMPRGDDSYSQGVRDGCATFQGVLGGGTLRLIKPKIDGYRMVEDNDYLNGYVAGSSYCTFVLDWDTH